MTGFCFLALNKNQSSIITMDQSDSRVKQGCDAHIQFPRDNLFCVIQQNNVSMARKTQPWQNIGVCVAE